MSQDDVIAFYVPKLGVGGAEQVTINIVNGLAELNYNIDLVVSYQKGELLKRVADPVSIVSLETLQVPVFGIGASIPSLSHYLETNAPALLFSGMTHANVVAITAARMSSTDTPVIPIEHLHFESSRNPKQALVQSFAKQLYRKTDRIVAVSEGVADSVSEHMNVSRSHISVIYNPIVTPELKQQSREPVKHRWFCDDKLDIVVSLGRVESQKNFPSLIRAFDTVHRSNPNTRLMIFGKGSQRRKLRAMVDEHGLQDVVELPGYVENPYRYLSKGSVFALSSRREGLPTVLVEALACGTPVVATDCPSGPREILADGEYGPLVPVGDEEALANGIHSQLKNPIDSELLRKRANLFSRETVSQNYASLIERETGVQPNCITHR